MTQEEALSILKTGANVFLTGEPGAGKTYVLNQYTNYLREHSVDVAITASTGIAATHIGGLTIHAWSGIGIKDHLTPYDLDQIGTRERVVKRVNSAKVLVIDEVSMLDGSVLEMVDQVCRTVRQKGEPFGGLQVVLVGDFFQLPPIAARGEQARFAFESSSWHELNALVCYITDQYRQEDEILLSMLGALRRGDVDESHTDILASCQNTEFPEHIEPTRLYTHNADVDRMNKEKLAEIESDARTFEMKSAGQQQLVDGLKKSCLSPEVLELKEDAMVMCTKNNFDTGFVNGTLGRVIGYETERGYPIIETTDGEELTIAPMEWSIEDNGKVLAEIAQVPLRLAWAITVHKSQGMSLDAADIDLSSAFEYGQGYVALSRVRSLKGLLLKGCNDTALRVHPRILEIDGSLMEQSEAASEAFEDTDKEELKEMYEKFILAKGGTLQKQKIEKKRPEEKIATHLKTLALIKKGKTLEEIAEARSIKLPTIIGHVEKLFENKEIKAEECNGIRFPEEKGAIADVLKDALKTVGTEKLKPIHEYTNGIYSYDDIHLARLLYNHGLL